MSADMPTGKLACEPPRAAPGHLTVCPAQTRNAPFALTSHCVLSTASQLSQLRPQSIAGHPQGSCLSAQRCQPGSPDSAGVLREPSRLLQQRPGQGARCCRLRLGKCLLELTPSQFLTDVQVQLGLVTPCAKPLILTYFKLQARHDIQRFPDMIFCVPVCPLQAASSPGPPLLPVPEAGLPSGPRPGHATLTTTCPAHSASWGPQPCPGPSPIGLCPLL